MSELYTSEPPTSGKIIVETNYGNIDIELFTLEAPKSCRNFIQHCLNKYYNGCIFFKIFKNFMIQTGDPTNTGNGGESIYSEDFRDELHSRLKFSHRGIVAMANKNKPNSNGSQFFITLDKCPEMDKKYTIFGKVTGPTFFNAVTISNLSANEDGVPSMKDEEKPKITNTQVVINPFKDLKPTVVIYNDDNNSRKKIKKKKKSKKLKIKYSANRMFFQDSEEEKENNDNKEIKDKADNNMDDIKKEVKNELKEEDNKELKLNDNNKEMNGSIKQLEENENKEKQGKNIEEDNNKENNEDNENNGKEDDIELKEKIKEKNDDENNNNEVKIKKETENKEDADGKNSEENNENINEEEENEDKDVEDKDGDENNEVNESGEESESKSLSSDDHEVKNAKESLVDEEENIRKNKRKNIEDYKREINLLRKKVKKEKEEIYNDEEFKKKIEEEKINKMNILQRYNYNYVKVNQANKLSNDERANKLKNFKNFIEGGDSERWYKTKLKFQTDSQKAFALDMINKELEKNGNGNNDDNV